MRAPSQTPGSRRARLQQPFGPRSPRRASILLVVLVTLLFASVAIVAFIEKASNDLTVETREALSLRLRRDAYSTLEVTLAVLQNFSTVNSGLHSPAEGWTDPLGFAGWSPEDGATAEVTFEDESGKLSLPHVDAATLVNLFQSWDLSADEAQRLTDGLLGWMRKDYVTASTLRTDYDDGTLPYAAPLRSLRSYSELAAIDVARDLLYDESGVPNDRWHRFVDAISLLDFKSTNINGGRASVYTALGSLDLSQQRMLSDYLNGTGTRQAMGPGFFQSASDAAALIGAGTLPSGYGTTITALRINIAIHQGQSVFHLSAIIAPSGGAAAVHTTAVSADAVNNPQGPSGASQPGTNTADSANSTNTNGNSPASTPVAKAQPPPPLKYPFTLLEITEKTEISAAPPPSSPPQA